MQSVVPSLATSTARTKPLAPSSIAVEAGKNDWSWLNKITVQKHQTDTSELHRHQWKMLQRTLTTFSRHKQRPKKNSFKDNEPHSYSEEIQQYIAESTANLNCGDEPQDSSDDDDDSDSDIAIPRNAEIFDFSDFVDDYVVPPVEVPRTYCLQDRQGGTLVAGDYVTFTNWAFKRQLRHIGDLCPIPERGEPGQDEDEPSQGIYSGMTVEL
ncbi:hypothetical protein PHYBOEH_011932 [Phytophthora boehmeriae]|uniref:Uncharacterized protein n=1 Tax=Phytophthora boehmeriae TaxID=109152 RepID=A0A8T1X1N4_9STRA|nr:hypothetical protein PHYBOEH_011932 [Phytophthora boehmeriae]